MNTNNAALDNIQKGATVFSGPEVSLSELQALVVSVYENTAKPDAIAVYQQIKIGAADAYFRSANYKRSDRSTFIQNILDGFTVADASKNVGIHRDTGYSWINDFCSFIGSWLRWDAECKRDNEARQVACEESCGRKKFPNPSKSGKLTSNQNTKKLDRPDWTRCMDCPVRRADVDV